MWGDYSLFGTESGASPGLVSTVTFFPNVEGQGILWNNWNGGGGYNEGKEQLEHQSIKWKAYKMD